MRAYWPAERQWGKGSASEAVMDALQVMLVFCSRRSVPVHVAQALENAEHYLKVRPGYRAAVSEHWSISGCPANATVLPDDQGSIGMLLECGFKRRFDHEIHLNVARGRQGARPTPHP